MEIRYKALHGAAEWVEVTDNVQDMLTLSFEPYHNGVLLLGGKLFALHNGEVTIAKSAISDGEYEPRLESDHGVYALERLTKIGDNITLNKTDETTIRRLITRYHRLEKAATSLEEKVLKLEKACHGHKIFDFERNKNEN